MTSAEIVPFFSQHPGLARYGFLSMENTGWGSCPNSQRLRSDRVHAADVFSDAFDVSEIMLLGDDTCGACIGFDPVAPTHSELTSDGKSLP
ncbi:hypothetical protein CA13_55940 [Planctomycetes bacterium CA13]|uniref:Uncharacterized protein n=1 Tax=Novipirellula herctigrandis TaxID=2527986 RepID=A0A5C5ZA84_9BACT|nr:hypothetical protein CA13_55940 [Planctomycetes bacterium CA13]